MKTNPLRVTFVTAWKDLQVIFKDRGFLVVVLALPAIFSVLFGTINQRSLDSSKESITFPVALVNQDSGPYGAQIVKILESIDALKTTSLAAPADAPNRCWIARWWPPW
jgi:hypothetical protein